MTFNEVADRVQMGSDMYFMKSKMDETTKKVTIDHENVDAISQRIPDWTRQPDLAGYLSSNNFRKFTTILAVVTPSWVDQPRHENWSSNGTALVDAIQFEPLDSKGDVGLINIIDSGIYALDGQHRVMGIRGIKELLNGSLEIKNKDGKPLRNQDSEEWMENYEIDDMTPLKDILLETISIEFIPAVISGETKPEATERLRNIFYNINTYAKKVDSSEQALFDVQNGYNIIAKKVATRHKLFQPSPSSKEKVKFKGTNIPDSSTAIVTLHTIGISAHNYFKEIEGERHQRWIPHKRHSPKKPIDEELVKAEDQFNELLDHISELPVYQSIDRGDSPLELRLFPKDKDDDERKQKLKGHLLLRNIGLPILTSAIGELERERSMEKKDIFRSLIKLDSEGKFSAHKPENLWFGVTYDFIKKRMIIKNNELAKDLLKYLIVGAEKDQRDELLEKVKMMRIIDNVERIWMNFSGGHSKWTDLAELPPI